MKQKEYEKFLKRYSLDLLYQLIMTERFLRSLPYQNLELESVERDFEKFKELYYEKRNVKLARKQMAEVLWGAAALWRRERRLHAGNIWSKMSVGVDGKMYIAMLEGIANRIK